jgi:predicted alpha/beta superfamily hydrolase
MKKYCLTTAIAVFLLFCLKGVQAQTTQTQLKQVCLDNTEQFSITSKYVDGESYIIQVGLPMGYSYSQKVYPVLCVTDGNVTFTMTKSAADMLMAMKEIKDIIIVGISYGEITDANSWNKKRIRIFYPTSDTLLAKGQNAGGADDFIKFIKYELFPVINKNYRTNSDSIAISGMSAGGLFNSYVLVTQPELFKGYIIEAPVLQWKNNSIFHLETEYFRIHKDLNTTVYIAYGSMDKLISIDNVVKFQQILKTHNYKGLNLVTRVFEGETHMSLPSTATADGLRTLFHY